VKIDRWATVHAWQKLVKQGRAKPLTAADGTEYIVRISADFEPVFWCCTDDSYMAPGLFWWEKLRDAVDQAELDGLDAGVLH
jgi:hypothetical protein